MSRFEALLEEMAPGSSNAADPLFPRELGLVPLGVLGRGGTGVVYRARDPVLDREVAVKISRVDGGAEAVKALLAEAQRTARLRHPAVVPVHQVVAANHLLCVVSDLAPAHTVEAALADARLDPGTWPFDDRLGAIEVVAGAVEAAHALGVVHGDLHPANLVLGEGNAPFVLDWSGDTGDTGTLSGAPAWLAPERLRGGAPTPAGDVYSLGLLLVSVATLRVPRPRLPGESLGAFVARWAAAEGPDLAGLPVDLAAVCAGALHPDPAQRPTAAALRQAIGALRSGRATRERRSVEAELLVVRAREALHRFQQQGRQLTDELTVVTVQRAKVPGYAPLGQKATLWAAEDRVTALRLARSQGWVEAADAATRVLTLAPDDHPANPEARRLLAQLWWERLLESEQRGDAVEARVAERWVRSNDDGPLVHALSAPARLDLTCDAEGAVARIYRFVERGRVLVAEPHDERPLPLVGAPLAPGSWLIALDAPGRATTRFPVALDRLEEHAASVRLFRPDQLGAGWVHVPAGRFLLGGDPGARQPLDPCRPWLPDRFFTETCIRTSEWLTFLDDLPVDAAAAHVPAESGLFGIGGRRYWAHDGTRWVLPPGWDPEWPIFSVNVADIEAYAAWRSAREGRLVRLPTEEEWEKAARGVDGRVYPWGPGFDPTFAHMRRSREGPPRPHRVADYPVDTSVYGLRDMAGGMRELTSSDFDAGQRVIRGGTWGDDADDLRCANRAGLQPDFRYSFISFRLVAEEPLSVGSGYR